MSAKPSNTPAVGATVKFSIPPEWFINVSAISRKNYYQGVFVQTNVRNNSSFFISEYGKNGPMRDSAFGLFTFPIAPRQTRVDLELSLYFADTNESLTAKKLRDPNYSSFKLDVQKSEKPEDASDDIPDYVTYFIFVEDTPDSAQIAGSGQFDDAVVTIHIVKTNPNPIPPPPPPNVIKPYNPILDLPRPSNLENYLKQYDVTFLIDDSPSMADENRWTEALNALDGLASYVIDSGFDANGIDLAFLNSDDKFLFKDEIHDITDKGKVAAALTKVGPNGLNGTPTGQRCFEILNKHLDRLDAVKGTQAYAEIKPLDLIVITDGAPNDRDPNLELTKVLIDVGARIKKPPTPHHPNSLGVQFVQIGNNPGAATALPKLIQADTGNIVDTVPYAGAGSISPDKLERILLGGLHPNIRAQNVI